jgi:hypothetical protein
LTLSQSEVNFQQQQIAVFFTVLALYRLGRDEEAAEHVKEAQKKGTAELETLELLAELETKKGGSVASAIGVGLGVVLAGAVLILGLLFRKRHH